jgi:hypothetical protein
MTEVIESEEVFEIEVLKKEKTLKYTVEDFTQSQSHGLFWDSEIREKVFGLDACKNDTKKYDICCCENKFNSTENVSIKTSSNGNIDCGDILRFFNGDFTNKYTIILIRYCQVEDSKKIKEVIEIDYNIELRNYLFGSIGEETLINYVNGIKNIPHGTVGNETKETYKKLKNVLQKEYNMKINISPKVDSKSQRRVQCSIPKLDIILELFPQTIISRTTESIIRGVKITSIINSGPRQRKSKSQLVSK